MQIKHCGKNANDLKIQTATEHVVEVATATHKNMALREKAAEESHSNKCTLRPDELFNNKRKVCLC